MIKKSTKTAVALLAGALAAATLFAGPIASASVDTTDAKATKGTLGWGVKESFRAYVEGPIADGGIEVTPPAVREDDGTFTWKRGKGRADAGADTAKITFKGTVYFYGHDDGTGPTLEIYVEKPRLVINGDNSVLIADVSSRLGGELMEYLGVELVSVDTSGLDLDPNGKGIVKVKNLSTTLTEDGAEAFAGFYEPGTAFDPISAKFKVAG
jgi:Htaa